MIKPWRCFCLAVVIFSLLTPPRAEASVFDFIVSDADMTDSGGMSRDMLKRFLAERGALSKQNFIDIDGKKKPAYEIIYRASVKYQLNPKFFIALLQREQSLIEDATLTQDQLDWALGYGICDSCDKSDPRLLTYKGFANQLENAARRLREIFDAEIGFKVGSTFNIDGIPVKPESKATAALYTYTPHLLGNNNFRDIWRRYFLMRYPDGTLLQPRGEDGVYLIYYGRKRAFASKSALTSRYDLNNIIQVARNELDAYEDGVPIQFPNFSLLQTADSAIFLLADDTLRPIDPETFRAIGWSPDELIPVEAADIESYGMGTPISAEHPTISDELVRLSNGNTFALRDGVRHPILSPEILRDRYSDSIPRKIAPNELTKTTLGEPILFRNGSLIKARGTSTVYLVTNGARRPFLTEKAFRSYGFEFRDVVTTTKAALEIHALGTPVSILPPTSSILTSLSP
ncbi:MAG: hypothetical protein WCJ29_01115 [bacterium]